MDTNC